MRRKWIPVGPDSFKEVPFPQEENMARERPLRQDDFTVQHCFERINHPKDERDLSFWIRQAELTLASELFLKDKRNAENIRILQGLVPLGKSKLEQWKRAARQ